MSGEQTSEQHFCGCCGNEIKAGTRSDPLWCARCKPHVLPAGLSHRPAWERTYFAQRKTDCPFQVSMSEMWPLRPCASDDAPTTDDHQTHVRRARVSETVPDSARPLAECPYCLVSLESQCPWHLAATDDASVAAYEDAERRTYEGLIGPTDNASRRPPS